MGRSQNDQEAAGSGLDLEEQAMRAGPPSGLRRPVRARPSRLQRVANPPANPSGRTHGRAGRAIPRPRGKRQLGAGSGRGRSRIARSHAGRTVDIPHDARPLRSTSGRQPRGGWRVEAQLHAYSEVPSRERDHWSAVPKELPAILRRSMLPWHVVDHYAGRTDGRKSVGRSEPYRKASADVDVSEVEEEVGKVGICRCKYAHNS